MSFCWADIHLFWLLLVNQVKQDQQNEKEQVYKQCQGQYKELEMKMNQLRDEKVRLSVGGGYKCIA